MGTAMTIFLKCKVFTQNSTFSTMPQLSRSKITIHRLKQLFGYSSEKKNRLKNSNPDVPPESGATEQTVSTVPLAITATEGIGAEIEPIEPSSKLGVLPENK